MPFEARLGLSLAVALAVAYWSTPMAIRVADRFEFYDRPVGYKGHGSPTPYLGGAAVVVGFLLAILLLTGDWGKTLPLAGGVGVLWAIGTVDDRRTVSPQLRVAVEIGLAALLWSLGLGWDLGAGAVVNLAVTAVWVVAVVNAFNLFDNMDGAASSMAGVVAVALAALGILQGDSWLAVAAAALAGACFGFLPHNLFSSPAKIFLGDGGSMPIGFAVAVLAMIGVADAAPAWQSLAMGVLFVGVPALDTALVVVSRTRRGVSVLTGGRDHLTHRAQQRLRTARAVALTLGATQAVVSVLAIAALQAGSEPIVVAVLLYAVTAGVAIAVLDSRMAPDTAGGPAAPTPAVAVPGRRLGIEVVAPALLVPLGLAAGLSPFFHGYYSSGLWVPGGLLLVPAATALAVARPVRLSRPAWLLLGSLAALAVWSLASASWADSVEQAVVEGNRLLMYAVGLGLLLLLVRDDRAALWAIGALAAAALVVGCAVMIRMLGSAPADLFIAGRLDQPLGYINGQAGFFLLAAWPCIAVAEQRRSAVLAGAALAAATLFACLALLSQSRGVAAAAAVSVVVVVALVPGRVRRLWALLAVGAGVAVAGPALLDIYSDGVDGPVAAGTVRDGALAALTAAVAAGVVWGVATAAARRLATRPVAARAAAVTLAVILAAGAGAAAVNGGQISRTVRDQYHAFVHLSVEPQGSAVGDSGSSRLVSGAGNRYDYWRVAWSAFKERPAGGWGAGNYDRPYFAGRTTVENIRQPHSIELQVLSELGIVGGVLLAALLAGVGWGAWRTARAARSSPAASIVAVAAIGTLGAWLTHTSVDWLHLLPGVTAAALVAGAVLVRRSAPVADSVAAPRRAARPRIPVAVGVALLLALAGLSLTRQGLAERYLHRGQEALVADPGRALVEADRALRLDPEGTSAYYLKSAALARFNRPAEARGALQEAARREPGKFVTWALLGDLAVRTGDLEQARRHYGRASALNPRDVTLRTLAADPRAASGAAR